MWTTKNRARYNRDKLRYPSDGTEEEWATIAPLIPPARRGGRKRTVEIREVFNGVLYLLSTGCRWRAIPKDLPPRSTLFHYLAGWEAEGTGGCKRGSMSSVGSRGIATSTRPQELLTVRA